MTGGPGGSNTVHTEDCIPASQVKATNKYKLNADFNEKSPIKDDTTEPSNVNSHNSCEWMPDVLKGQSWGDQVEINNDNPYLSVSAKGNTIVKVAGADADAEWQKYRKEEFVRQLNNNNFKLMPPGEEQEFVADTFANKSKNKSHSLLSESFTPSSPLKLFGDRQDTYTKDRFKNILKYVNDNDSEPKDDDDNDVSKILQNSNKLYEKAIANGKQQLPQPGTDENGSSMTYSDATSDADEFSGKSPGTADAFMRDGDDLYQNLKRKLSLKLPQMADASDYTDEEFPDNDVTSTLQYLKKELQISAKKPLDVSEPVSTPHLASNTPSPMKHKGMNFISAEEYKDKVFDKHQNKYVSREEYEMLYGKEQQQLSESSLSSISETKPAVSFNEMSFSQTNESLVAAITETYPEEDWDEIEQLDISNRQLDKLRGLDKFTPKLWILSASDNGINHIDGVPDTVRILKLNHNHFDSMAAFHLPDLQVLHLSDNSLENLSGLVSLTNLTSLVVRNNQLTNVDHLQGMRMLRHLDISHNRLKGQLDFGEYQLCLLENLVLDANKFTALVGIESLPSLINLSANSNLISAFSCDGVQHLKLRRLSMNKNRLQSIDLSSFPNLMRLALDRNDLSSITGLGKYIGKVSFKYQSNSGNVGARVIENATQNENLRWAEFTGGAIAFDTISTSQFCCLTKLNLSAMTLQELPSQFSKLFPLLTELNLNFNNLTSIKPLKGLTRLRQLNLLGNSIESLEDVIMSTENVRSTLRLLDLRVNPFNKGFYPYVFYDNENEDVELDEITMLNLHDYDDIEAFSVEYSRLYEQDQVSRWQRKNTTFAESEAKRSYQMKVIVWFYMIRYLDGLKVDSARHTQELNRFVTLH